jgi:hypothetical protein
MNLSDADLERFYEENPDAIAEDLFDVLGRLPDTPSERAARFALVNALHDLMMHGYSKQAGISFLRVVLIEEEERPRP